MAGIINGNPTKVFFIEMLTRDISITDAIIDLLDNSIDGASSINKDDYSNLFINITINENEFIVEDNCGGFSLDTAQKYAFRFGRPEDAPPTTGTVGRFGVGMKRALFKMGKMFEVESKTNDDHFQVDVNVADWKEQKTTETEGGTQIQRDDWNFNYSDIDNANKNLDNNGTYIRVTNLYEEVSNLFIDESFLNDLTDDIERVLNFSLEKGIAITLNGKVLSKKGIYLLMSERVKPYHYEGEKNGVNFKVLAGLSYTGDPSIAGWYIYCNDRLVVEADSSELTGWGVRSNVKFHPDYAMFRGILFLDSEDTLKLPLTTTKKGIDSTANIYKTSRTFMDEGMNYVLAFLKNVRKLEDSDDYRNTLNEVEDKKNVVELKTEDFSSYDSRRFYSPDLNSDVIKTKKDFVRISFSTGIKLAEKAKIHSGSKNYKELGENVFDYYTKMEELLDE